MHQTIHLIPNRLNRNINIFLFFIPILIFILVLALIVSRKPQENISNINATPTVLGEDIP